MTAVPTRIVNGYVQKPDGSPWAAKTVTAKLSTLAFVGSNAGSLTTEIIREAYATTDASGLYSFNTLSVNTAITSPSGTYYTIKVAGDSSVLSIVVPAGDPTIPVWVPQCLINDPVNPNPPYVVLYGFGDVDGGSASSTNTFAQVLNGGSAAA